MSGLTGIVTCIIGTAAFASPKVEPVDGVIMVRSEGSQVQRLGAIIPTKKRP